MTTLPPIGRPGISMQNENPFAQDDSNAFQPLQDDNNFDNGPFNNEEEGGAFGNQPFNQYDSNNNFYNDGGAGGFSYNMRQDSHALHNNAPLRTAGEVTLKEVRPEEYSREPYSGRDAAILIEGELRQFDNIKLQEKGGQVAVQRYVESLVTGNFWQVQKEIGLQGPGDDGKDGAKMIVQSNSENYEREMKEVQRLWINRIHKLFHLFLGLLAGMSLIHLIVINNSKSLEQFLNVYANICKDVNIVFMIFTSFALILGTCLAMIYKNKSDEKMRNMDPFRMEFRQQYMLSLIISIVIAVAQCLLYILPHFTNKFYYYNPVNVTQSDLSNAQGLYSATNVLLMLTWVMASAVNKASINDLDMDPEDSNARHNDEVDTTDGGSTSFAE